MLAWLRKFHLVSILLFIFCLVMIGDFANFFYTCRRYSKLSADPTQLLPAQVLEKEAIVVLTGDKHRIRTSIELLKQRMSPLMVISGTGRGATLTELINTNSDVVGNAQEIWSKIVVESQSTSTIENAKETAKILIPRGITRVILITSEYHVLRSLLVFRSIAGGPEYIPYPTPSEFTGLVNLKGGEIVEGFWKVFLEYWKYFLFRNYYMRHIDPKHGP